MSLISVLISTYNRKELVKRALDSVISQTYSDMEIYIIDDASEDGTEAEIRERYPDKRLKYIYNTENKAGVHGDKVHIRRFVHELARGKWWIYLDSDDWWLDGRLLAREVALFEGYPGAAMVTGGQESYFVPEDRLSFTPGIFPYYLESEEFIRYFSQNPTKCNIIGGARLYDRELFIKSGALRGNEGRWESGFELSLAPGCYGGHVYIDEACIRTEIRPENASFNETQRRHFLDSCESVQAGFRQAKLDFPDRGLAAAERRTVENLGQAYLRNAQHVRGGGVLSYCSEGNVSELVRQEDVDMVLAGL